MKNNLSLRNTQLNQRKLRTRSRPYNTYWHPAIIFLRWLQLGAMNGYFHRKPVRFPQELDDYSFLASSLPPNTKPNKIWRPDDELNLNLLPSAGEYNSLCDVRGSVSAHDGQSVNKIVLIASCARRKNLHAAFSRTRVNPRKTEAPIAILTLFAAFQSPV